MLTANDAFRTLVLAGSPVQTGTSPWVNALPQERMRCEELWVAHGDSRSPFVVEFRLASPTGDDLWILLTAQPVVDDGVIVRYVGTATDATFAVQQRQLSDQLVGLLDAAGDAVLVFDRVGDVQFANDAARTILGITEPGLPRDDAAARAFMQAVRDQLPRELLDHHDPRSPVNKWDGEVAMRSPDGLARTLAVVVQVVRDRNGAVQHWSTIARDVTDDRHVQRELHKQATHDALTGLPNRVLLLRKASEALERRQTTKSNVALLFIDLDKLKHVNDTIGHAVGDQLITTVAKRLVAATRPNDVVARISGDEFVILCDGILDEHMAVDVAERIRSSITGPLVLQGIEIEAGASVGVAMASDELLAQESPADAAVTLLRCADTAMYRAKQRGRGRTELYTEDMRRAARARNELAAELEQALAARQFHVLFQPLESAQTGRTVAFEALLRWDHPTRGVLSPGDFLELADESGLIGPVGDWVLRTTTESLREWIDLGFVDPHTSLHMNVTRRQLADSTFVERVTTILAESGLAGAQLVLETSESSLIDNNPSVLRTVNGLKRHAIRMAVDDFGAGHSSLASLRTFPADMLKLDGTLVRDVGRTDGADDPIVRSIIQLAHSLDLVVVAEWVSTADQIQRLRALGCDVLQGNKICEPLTAADVRARYFTSGAGPVPAK